MRYNVPARLVPAAKFRRVPRVRCAILACCIARHGLQDLQRGAFGHIELGPIGQIVLPRSITSAQDSPTSSEMRRPPAYSVSSITRSRRDRAARMSNLTSTSGIDPLGKPATALIWPDLNGDASNAM